MVRSLSLVLVAGCVLQLAAGASRAAADPGPGTDAPLQLVVVRTASWDAVEATLERYERAAATAPWQRVGPPVAAVVGRSGLGWGSGLHLGPAGAGPVKREGDGRAPAGMFRLSAAFGYDALESMSWVRLPYTHATESIQCVDDVDSPYYNRIVDRATVADARWTSHEDMRRRDELYRMGVVVDHNAAPPARGGGSCIFLHIWRGASRGTSGCTAFAAPEVESLLRWLDPGKHPVLVQLPAAEYDRLKPEWGLP
jgi:L,D-peptidoglycan transpeptidase YkuD (ErfK/YbiS/YcfS/YnhG family)